MSTARRRKRIRNEPVRAWTAAWVGGAALGVANGIVREGTYGRRLPEPAANAISVASAIGLFVAYFGVLQHRWPLRSSVEAARVGAVWFALTMCFEVGVGRARGKTWADIGGEYDLRRGRLWPLVLISLTAGPEIVRRRSSV